MFISTTLLKRCVVVFMWQHGVVIATYVGLQYKGNILGKHPIILLHFKKQYIFSPSSITGPLLYIKGMLHVSAFSVGCHEAIEYFIKT